MTFNKACWLHIICSLFISVSGLLGQNHSLEDLLKQLPLETNDSIKAEVLAELGDLYYDLDFDSTVYYYKEAIALSKIVPYFSIEFSSWRSLGYVYSHRKNDFEASLAFFQKAVELGTTQSDSVAIAYGLSDIGRILWKQGKPYEALEYHLQVKEIGEKINSPKVTLRANTSLGIIENENGNNEKAKEYYQEALLLATSLKRNRSIGIILNNMGKACQDDKQYDMALKYFSQSDSIFTALKDNGWLSLISFNKGKNFVLQGFPEKGIEYYKLALNLNESIENKEREVMILSALAIAHLKLNQPRQSVTIGKKALSILKEIDTVLYYDELYKTLAESYELLGDQYNSLQYSKQYLKFENEVNRLEEIKKIASLNQLYELKKKENKILELKTITLKKDKDLEVSSSNLKVMIFAFFSLLSLFFLAFYVNKLKEFKKFDQLKSTLSNDLHDNIGTSLNHIKMLSQRMRKKQVTSTEKEMIITKIKTTSDELIYNMHDMVWSLDKKKETVGGLLERMQDHADVFLGDFNIPYKINIDIPNKDTILDAEKKVNVYLIFKESINNILKHTETDNILISLVKGNNQHFKMSVSNFYSSKKETVKLSTNQGINNMKKRAQNIGGTLHITDNPGCFSIEFSF